MTDTMNMRLEEAILEEYWLQYLNNLNAPTDLPTFSLSNNASKINKKIFQIDTSTYNRLVKISRNSNLGLYTIFLTAISCVLKKYGNEEILIGTTSFREMKKMTEPNIILLRNSISLNMNFKENLNNIKKNLLDVIKYQNYSIKQLEQQFKIQGINIIDFFKIGFVFDEINDELLSNDIFKVLIRYNKKNELVFEYDNIYLEQTIELFGQQLINFINTIIVSNNIPLKDIDILTDKDIKILNNFNNTNSNFPSNVTFQELFEEQVKKTPNNIAVEFLGENLTYEQLNRKANRIAHFLRHVNVEKDTVIAIYLNRSIVTLITILAIFKAGGAYIPIDVKFPMERIKVILEESKAKFLITDSIASTLNNNFYFEIANNTNVETIIHIDDMEEISQKNLFKFYKVASLLKNNYKYPLKEYQLYSESYLAKDNRLVDDVKKLESFLRIYFQNKVKIAIMIDNPIISIAACIALNNLGISFISLDTHQNNELLLATLEKNEVKCILTEQEYINKIDSIFWKSDMIEDYILLDDFIINESQTEEEFKKIWNMIAEDSSEEINDYGWINSYSGEKFSYSEMNQYIDNFKTKLSPYLDSKSRVLEIGCGHGLVLSNIAEKVDYYLATDLSEVIISKNKLKAKKNNLKNVDFLAIPASSIGNIKNQKFDIVVCSSVVHYFPNTIYLEKVIMDSIQLINDKGIIYFDDLLDLDKKDIFVNSLRNFKASHQDKNVKLEWDDDLFVNKSFFEWLKNKYPEIIDYEISNKIGQIKNELTEYRYDVILKIDKTHSESIDKINEKFLFSTKFRNKNVIMNEKNPFKENLLTINKYDRFEDLLNGFDVFKSIGVFDKNTLDSCSNDNLNIVNSSNDLSYVIYTSGSTGKPKGAMIEHVGMINHLYAKIREIKLNEQDVILQNASYTFDISVWQFLAPLLVGAKCIIYPDDTILNIRNFVKNVIKDQVTILEVVPSYLSILLEELEQSRNISFKKLRYLFVTGESISLSLVKRWYSLFPHIKIINAYGPTEASDDITHYLICNDTDEDDIFIGKPIQNLKIYVVDKYMKLCPIGVKGELCVSGVGVGRGYLNNDKKTVEVFIVDPFQKNKKVRLYKTGDIGRWLSDGNIQFYGRKDYQVKIRGFRIELGEIENKILNYNRLSNKCFSVKNVAVIDQIDKSGNKYLSAYIETEGEFYEKSIVQYLEKYLPNYMIPTQFITIKQFPLTAHGKIDRKKIAQITDIQKKKILKPKTLLEDKLLSCWIDILNIKEISIDDDFFQIGGHSLKATQLVARIYRDLNTEVPLKQFFETPTIIDIAKYIEKSQSKEYSKIPKTSEKKDYATSFTQKRMFIFAELNFKSTAYNLPMMYKLSKNLDVKKFEDVINMLIRRHEAFRTYFNLVDDQIVQVIKEKVDFKVIVRRVDSLSLSEAIHDFIKPFNLRTTPLFRIELLETSDWFYLMFDMHHIIADGVSQTIFIKEFIRLYNGEELADLNIQYKDYAEWQQEDINLKKINHQENYWLKKIGKDIPILNLYTDFKRPNILSYKGNKLNVRLDEIITTQIREIAVSNKCTVYMVLLSIIFILMHKYSGQEDILIGTPTSGRTYPETDNIIGVFINTLVLRNQPIKKKKYVEFLSEVRKDTIEAFENQDYPFDMLVEKLKLRKNKNRHYLFDVMFSMNNIDNTNKTISNITFEEIQLGNPTCKFDLNFTVNEQLEYMDLSIEYSEDLFKLDTILKMKNHFVNIIKSIYENIDITIDDISIIDDLEQKQLLKVIEEVKFESKHEIDLNI